MAYELKLTINTSECEWLKWQRVGVARSPDVWRAFILPKTGSEIWG